MKILLAACNAKYIHSNLAVYDLQAYASEYADHIILKEYTINQQKDDIMRDIYLEHPVSSPKDFRDTFGSLLRNAPRCQTCHRPER